MSGERSKQKQRPRHKEPRPAKDRRSRILAERRAARRSRKERGIVTPHPEPLPHPESKAPPEPTPTSGTTTIAPHAPLPGGFRTKPRRASPPPPPSGGARALCDIRGVIVQRLRAWWNRPSAKKAAQKAFARVTVRGPLRSRRARMKRLSPVGRSPRTRAARRPRSGARQAVSYNGALCHAGRAESQRHGAGRDKTRAASTPQGTREIEPRHKARRVPHTAQCVRAGKEPAKERGLFPYPRIHSHPRYRSTRDRNRQEARRSRIRARRRAARRSRKERGIVSPPPEPLLHPMQNRSGRRPETPPQSI